MDSTDLSGNKKEDDSPEPSSYNVVKSKYIYTSLTLVALSPFGPSTTS
jgi:hypothetical protein